MTMCMISIMVKFNHTCAHSMLPDRAVYSAGEVSQTDVCTEV